MTVHALMTMGIFGVLSSTMLGSVSPTPAMDPALIIFGNEVSEALAFDRLFGVLVRLVLLWLGLQVYETLITRFERWRLGIAHSLDTWAPTVRLTVGGLMVVVIIDALTPEQPAARAIVAGGVIVTVLWSAQAVLRNAAAGAVIIAKRAVRLGEHLRVGEVSGKVTSVTLRGVELLDADGSRTFVPGLLLHTEMTSHGPAGVGARSIQLTWRLPADATERDPEEVRSLVKRLALLSTRRAPGTPVLVTQGAAPDELDIRLTPFDRDEADALRLEVTRRLGDAFAPPRQDEDDPA